MTDICDVRKELSRHRDVLDEAPHRSSYQELGELPSTCPLQTSEPKASTPNIRSGAKQGKPSQRKSGTCRSGDGLGRPASRDGRVLAISTPCPSIGDDNVDTRARTNSVPRVCSRSNSTVRLFRRCLRRTTRLYLHQAMRKIGTLTLQAIVHSTSHTGDWPGKLEAVLRSRRLLLPFHLYSPVRKKETLIAKSDCQSTSHHPRGSTQTHFHPRHIPTLFQRHCFNVLLITWSSCPVRRAMFPRREQCSKYEKIGLWVRMRWMRVRLR